MLVIGLTGGIASGKSTVAACFARLGIPIIDADVIARQVTAPGTTALSKIKKHFGVTIINAQGELNRRQLRQLIFADAQERQWLEQLLHPIIQQEIIRQIAEITAPYCIVVIPLLIETGPYPFLNRILVIDTDEQTQIARLIERDHFTATQAQQALSLQATRNERLSFANDIIHNNTDFTTLERAVNQLHQSYIKLQKN